MPPTDNEALNLAKAIKKAETGDAPNAYSAKGKSGEFGAYQFMPDTYKSYAKKYLGNEAAEPTVENQNKIAYSFAKEKKDAGFTPAQIASMWNAGEAKPNAYKEGHAGTNSMGVQYDTPGYVAKVSQQYKQLSGGIPQGGAGDNIARTPTIPEIPLPGNVAHAAEGEPPAPDNRGFLQKASDIVGSIFPGGKVGQSIGTLGGYAATKIKDAVTGSNTAQYYDLSSPSVAQVAGDIAQGALTVGAPGVGRASGALAPTVLGKAIPALKPAATGLGTFARTAAAGAGIGAAGGVAEGDDYEGIIQRSLVGGAVGGVLGAPAGAIKAIANTRNPASIIARRAGELQKLEDSYSVVRKVTENAKKKGVDVKDLLAKTDLLKGAVDETGTIRTQQAMAELNDFIKPQEDIIGRLLQSEGKTLPLTQVEKILKDAVNRSGVQGGALTRALKNVDDDVAGYALRADEAGNVPLSLIHEAKVDKYANINYLNPESKRVDKTIAKALKEIVEKEMTIADAKKLNEELGAHYSVLNLLEKLDGKKVQGGKLGKYFAQTVGSIVGSHFGPLGSIVGAEAGGRLLGKQMAGTFGRATGNTLQRSQTMQEALNLAEKAPVRKLKVNELPTGYTNELPTIDAGTSAPSRFDNLPVATGAPNVYTPYSKSAGIRKNSHQSTKGKSKSSKGSRNTALKNKSR